MKFAPVAILFSALAVASPVYQVEWVTVIQYTTVVAIQDEFMSSFPQTTESPAAIQELSTKTYSEENIGSEPTTAPTTTVPFTTSSTETSDASREVFSGDGTWYDTGLGACGWTNTNTDYIVALGRGLFDQYTPNGNPNLNTLCGKKIIAHYEGKSVEVTAVDRCVDCSPYDLDFSPAAFEQLQLTGERSDRIQITWSWA